MIRILSLILSLSVSGGAYAAAGTLQYIIECVPTGTAGAKTTANVNNNPCNTLSGVQQYPRMTQRYILDTTSATYIDPIAQPFDYTSASAIYIFFFSSVIMLWFAAKNMGIIINAVRNLGERWR